MAELVTDRDRVILPSPRVAHLFGEGGEPVGGQFRVRVCRDAARSVRSGFGRDEVAKPVETHPALHGDLTAIPCALWSHAASRACTRSFRV